MDEMRPHLQDGGTRPLPRGFLLLLPIAVNQLAHQKQLHKNTLDIRRHKETDHEENPLCPCKFLPSSDQRDRTDHGKRREHDHIEGRPWADLSLIRCRDGHHAERLRDDLHRDQDAGQCTLEAHDRALSPVFSAAMEEIGCYEQSRNRGGQRSCEEQHAAQRNGRLIKESGFFHQVDSRDDNG